MVGQSLPVRAHGPALAAEGRAGSRRTAWRLILNLAAFQTGWLAAVLGAAQGLAWPGPTVAAGEALGAIRLEGHALPAIALGWAVALPVLLALASRWNGCVAATEIGA